MANREALFQEIQELNSLQQLGMIAHNLRGEQLLDPRQRIDALFGKRINANGVTSFGGNSSAYIMRKGRIISDVIFQTGAIHLQDSSRSKPYVAMYPFGIVGSHVGGAAVFEDPNESTRRSIALEYPDYTAGIPWLQYRVEPLFNVEQDGNVFARINDAPTREEFRLLDRILENFEAGVAPAEQRTA